MDTFLSTALLRFKTTIKRLLRFCTQMYIGVNSLTSTRLTPFPAELHVGRYDSLENMYFNICVFHKHRGCFCPDSKRHMCPLTLPAYPPTLTVRPTSTQVKREGNTSKSHIVHRTYLSERMQRKQVTTAH